MSLRTGTKIDMYTYRIDIAMDTEKNIYSSFLDWLCHPDGKAKRNIDMCSVPIYTKITLDILRIKF